ncbi:hypothetical protein H5410_016762 [Solanum commersonii]|uniref:Uncharacterized protein n=1 Tax=Solanum commersonii TaxID=4109 RepID=A0A9J5ZY79_SOLCO|nr:hypothetical protein H5410_016762 [Solanum commersonii]
MPWGRAGRGDSRHDASEASRAGGIKAHCLGVGRGASRHSASGQGSRGMVPQDGAGGLETRCLGAGRGASRHDASGQGGGPICLFFCFETDSPVYKKVPHEMGRLHYVVQGAEADKRRSDVTGSRCGNNLAEILVPVIYIDSIHVFSGLLEERAKSPVTIVGPVVYLCSVYEA